MAHRVVGADFVIERAELVATCAGPAPRKGLAQNDISPQHDASIASLDGRIVYVGPSHSLTDHVDVRRDAVRVGASGCCVVPGFVDAHTHLVFAGDRGGEIRQRLGGATYREIAAAGGGIAATVAATRAASRDELVALSRPRLDAMLATGTTTCEVKSGYGLTLETELRQLEAIRRLDQEHPIDLVSTFLGAHVAPAEQQRREDYVNQLLTEMIPTVASSGLAAWCDVFCEGEAFTPEESTRILEAGLRAGLKPRIHANEFDWSGGAVVAARVGARSADHLVYLKIEEADDLAAANVCAVLLPAASLFLKLGRFAPARLLIGRNVSVALGTDFNPGGGLSSSMPFVMTLACFAMAMTLEEALIAATLNAAWSLDRSDSVGSLERGKLMDAVIVEGDMLNLLRVGAPSIRAVVKKGKVVWTNGR